MKKREIYKKLVLNKETIVSLNEMNHLRAGDDIEMSITCPETDCSCVPSLQVPCD